MSPSFLTPWAGLGAVLLPLLAVVYLLYRHPPLRKVSSLVLFPAEHWSTPRGMKPTRRRLPWVFWLELLLLACAVLAAMGPQLRLLLRPRQVAVVLDNSLSMRAGEPGSPRQAAEALLREWLGSQAAPESLVLAGSAPRVLPLEGGLTAALSGWSCWEPQADLPAAIALARELAGPTAQILVLTDHLPAEDALRTGVTWRALGRALPNTSITHASRAGRESGPDRLRLVIEHFGESAVTLPLTLRDELSGAVLHSQEVRVEPGKPLALTLAVPESAGLLRVALPEDALPADSTMLLPRQARREVSVGFRGLEREAAEALRRGLGSLAGVRLVESAPDLLFASGPMSEAALCRVELPERPPEPRISAGPFLVDSTHPLAADVSLQGTFWAISPEFTSSGIPIIQSELGVHLSWRLEEHRPVLRLNWLARGSTVQRSVAWPMLMQNLVDWCREYQPGPVRSVLTAGEELRVRVPAGVAEVTVREPGGGLVALPQAGSEVAYLTGQPGLLRVQADGRDLGEVAVNVVGGSEGDLRQAARGEQTSPPAASETVGVRDLGPTLLVLCLGLVLGHTWLLQSRFRQRWLRS